MTWSEVRRTMAKPDPRFILAHMGMTYHPLLGRGYHLIRTRQATQTPHRKIHRKVDKRRRIRRRERH